jgi:AcrR family transcriptional regulator
MSTSVKTHRLTTERVVSAALAVADESGLESVSLRRLAAELGVTPMAIYRHVRDKNHLLDLMADRLVGQLDLGSVEEPTWQGAFRRLAGSFLAVLQAHPAAPFLLSRPFDSVAALRVSEATLSVLDRAGFRQDESVRLMQVMTGMVLGPALLGATYDVARRDRPPDVAGREASIEALSSGEFPHLARATDQVQEWTGGADADRLTIELLVRGLELLAHDPNRGLDPRRGRTEDHLRRP